MNFFVNNEPCLLLYIEIICKEVRDRLIINGINDIRVWDICGSEIIIDIYEENIDVKPNDLTLVCLFKG